MQALNPDNLCGRAPKQVEDFITKRVNPVLEKYAEWTQREDVEIKV